MHENVGIPPIDNTYNTGFPTGKILSFLLKSYVNLVIARC